MTRCNFISMSQSLFVFLVLSQVLNVSNLQTSTVCGPRKGIWFLRNVFSKICLFHFTNLFYVIGRDAPLHVVLKNEVTLEKLSKEFGVSRDAFLRALRVPGFRFIDPPGAELMSVSLQTVPLQRPTCE